MPDLKFLHISDTHFLQEYGSALHKWGVHYQPDEIFINFLKTFNFDGIDFIVHTGDLIHDGNGEDYQKLFEIFDQYIPKDIPIYLCLGNHDNKKAFFEAKQEENRKSYFYGTDFKGYRLVFLDTAVEGEHDGAVSEEQFSWLKSLAEAPSDKGTLIFQHHPLDISWIDGLEKTSLPVGYKEFLNHSDVLGIFTGHLHQNRHYMIDSIPQHTAGSFVFGMTIEGRDEVWNTNRLGYSVVTIRNGNIDVFTEIVNPTVEKFNQEIL